MKPIKIFSIMALVAIAAVASTAFINGRLLKKMNTENKGFAVVELFTSEGCSSCPPADELVAKIEKESGGKPVYILAYHVDYWNSLGWKDVFSSADFSKRQREYAAFLHLPQIYTPQIIVNGKTEFVGSEEGTLRKTIKTALEKETGARLDLTGSGIVPKQVHLKYATEGADKNDALLLAYLQKNAQTKVKRGENAGRTLSHVQIVCKLQRVPLNGNQGSINVTLPRGFDLNEWEIIGFLQNTLNGSVKAASRVRFDTGISDRTSASIIKNH